MWNQETLNSFNLKSAEKVLAKIKSGELEMISYNEENLKDDTFIIYKNVAPPSDNYYWMHSDREEEPVPTIIMHYVQSQGSSSHSNILMDHSKWIGPVSYKVTDVISMKLWKTRPDIYNLLPLAYSFLNWRVNPFEVKT